jgi:hypothetical protein
MYLCMYALCRCVRGCMYVPRGGSQVQGKPVSTLLQGKGGLIPRSDFFFFFFWDRFFFFFFSFCVRLVGFPQKRKKGTMLGVFEKLYITDRGLTS